LAAENSQESGDFRLTIADGKGIGCSIPQTHPRFLPYGPRYWRHLAYC